METERFVSRRRSAPAGYGCMSLLNPLQSETSFDGGASAPSPKLIFTLVNHRHDLYAASILMKQGDDAKGGTAADHSCCLFEVPLDMGKRARLRTTWGNRYSMLVRSRVAKEMATKNKDHTRRPRGGAHEASALQPCLPCGTRMLRSVTRHRSTEPQRSGLRLRHSRGGKHDLYDGPGTACVARADLVRCRLVVSAGAVCAEMSSPTNEIAKCGV
ncbi:hypothetical protein C7974DRAFT_125406 [Boeremia exigua]|uniref:uncharacterized protein n=1 Tax=Boeremia exigua TaxID=749465 RepID=UPI001E8D42DB|nr:uncharacterized protein C7974DRAFT_125406 [Boeremia exigua]KAH6639044.1 hypothetical protein C7974DRAFT_125406 [Boeremia exigua]